MRRYLTLSRPNLRSVRARTTLAAALAICALVLLSGVAIERLVAREIRGAADATLEDQAVDRAQLLVTGADPATLVNVIGDEVLAVILAPDGTVLAAQGTTPDMAAGLTVLEPGFSTISITLVETDDEDGEDEEPHAETVRAAVAVADDGSRVIVGNENEGVVSAINAVRALLLIGGPLVAAAGALVAWLVTGQALAPVDRLRRDLDGVTRAGGRVTEPATHDEIQALAEATNEVLARLDAQSAARRRFVADASHELKSPIANARVLLDTDDGTDPLGLQRRVTGELDRLQSLVDDLLFLARTDETVAPDPVTFDLDDLLFDEAERLQTGATVTIDAGGVQPAQVVADRSEVARAVRNLLENAVRHARSRVSVSIEPDPAGQPDRASQLEPRWLVVVSDDGPGIPAADREKVFERFTRLDHDRARIQGGTGLGLSIVAAIATRNGGRAAVDEVAGGGARFTLAVPAAS